MPPAQAQAGGGEGRVECQKEMEGKQHRSFVPGQVCLPWVAMELLLSLGSSWAYTVDLRQHAGL